MSEHVDPTKVMVNGAAVALLTSMFKSIKEDLAATEERLIKTMEDKFLMHESVHGKEDSAALHEHKRLGDAIHFLEQWRHEETMNRKVRDAKRAGQMWLPLTTYSIVSRHWKVGIAVIAAATGAFAAGSADIVNM